MRTQIKCASLAAALFVASCSMTVPPLDSRFDPTLKTSASIGWTQPGGAIPLLSIFGSNYQDTQRVEIEGRTLESLEALSEKDRNAIGTDVNRSFEVQDDKAYLLQDESAESAIYLVDSKGGLAPPTFAKTFDKDVVAGFDISALGLSGRATSGKSAALLTIGATFEYTDVSRIRIFVWDTWTPSVGKEEARSHFLKKMNNPHASSLPKLVQDPDMQYISSVAGCNAIVFQYLSKTGVCATLNVSVGRIGANMGVDVKLLEKGYLAIPRPTTLRVTSSPVADLGFIPSDISFSPHSDNFNNGTASVAHASTADPGKAFVRHGAPSSWNDCWAWTYDPEKPDQAKNGRTIDIGLRFGHFKNQISSVSLFFYANPADQCGTPTSIRCAADSTFTNAILWKGPNSQSCVEVKGEEYMLVTLLLGNVPWANNVNELHLQIVVSPDEFKNVPHARGAVGVAGIEIRHAFDH